MRGKVKLKHTEDYYLKVLLKETLAREIMTTPVVSVSIHADFQQVPDLFRENIIRHLPVVTQDGKLAGLITQRDLFRICPPKKREDGTFYFDRDLLAGIILEHVMIQAPFFMHEQDPMGDVLVHLVDKKIGCVPIVTSDKTVCGIITQIDILKVAAQIYQE